MKVEPSLQSPAWKSKEQLLALPGLGLAADIQQFIDRKEAAMQFKDVQQMDGSITRLYWAPFPATSCGFA